MFRLGLLRVAGLASRGSSNLHRQLTSIGVTGLVHPLVAECFDRHPRPREVCKFFCLIGIQSKRLGGAIHFSDWISLKIVQVSDSVFFFQHTRPRQQQERQQ